MNKSLNNIQTEILARKLALLAVFAICIIPIVANLLGIDFASNPISMTAEKLSSDELKPDDFFHAVSGGVHHALLEWSAVTIALLAALASFIHYWVKRDITIPIIGMALLSAGMVDAFHTLAATRIIHAEAPNTDFIPFTWAISRIFNAGTMMTAVLVSMWFTRRSSQGIQAEQSENKYGFLTIAMVSGLFMVIAYIVVHQAAISSDLPKTMYFNALIKRPFDVLPLAMFVLAGALIWHWYQQSQSMMRWALLISIVPEIISQLHMVFGSTVLFDNHFNVAHFLKNIAYGCIFLGILIDLVNTDPERLMKEKRLQNKKTIEPCHPQEQIKKMLKVGYAKRPLSVQLPIAAFLLSLLVASVVGFTFYNETTRIAIETNERYLVEKNRQIQTTIYALYKEHFDHLTLISKFPQLQRIAANLDHDKQADVSVDLSDFESQILEIVKKRKIYTGIKYIQLNTKMEISAVVQVGDGVNLIDKSELKFYQFLPFLNKLETLKHGNMMFSSIESWDLKNRENKGPLKYKLALPVYQIETNKVLGLVILQVDFKRFTQVLASLATKDIDLFMANDEGVIIDAPPMSQFPERNNRLLTIFPQLKNIKTNKFGSALLETERLNINNHSVHSLYQVFKNSQFGEGHLFRWVIRPSEDRLVDALEQIKNRSFWISFGLAFFVLAVSFLASRKITGPLTQMINAIRGFEENVELENLPIGANDETGVLARSFHNMQILKNFKDAQVKVHQYALDQHAIVSATNIKGEIIFVNSKFEEISGFTKQELMGQNHRILNSGVHENEFFEQMYKKLKHGQVWNGEICNQAKNGSHYWVDATIVPLINETGKPHQYIAIRTDITEKKKWEQQLVKAIDESESATHAKSEFFASMSHEIRTPMNGVLGMLGLMMRTELTRQQKHYATLARSSADSLLAIIDDILDLSKIEAGKIELEILDFNLREQLGIFAEAMAYRAQDKGLEMVLDVTGIEHSMVKGDPVRLRQILNNLVGNAIKFTQKGEISVIASLQADGNDEWIFNCEVSDTGMGIPDDKVGSLFDSYSQVDSSTTRKFGGTGLGLAIVKQLSKLMNGKVEVKSEFGKGSQFIFEVRFAVSQSSQLVVPKQDIQGTRILIVDDNPTNLEVLSGQLEHWGADIVSAESGKQALNILQQQHHQDNNNFEIAILDMGMPDMDGAELGQIIRSTKDYDSIKLVMMTSMAGSGDISKFKHIGFSAYFPKPATTADLFHALQVLVEDGPTLAQLDGMVTNYNITNMTSTNVFSSALVLLVEDNPINQEVAIGILEDMGVSVDVAENGLQAIEKLLDHQKNYGLVIMDCQMPEMDGYEATREIRSRKHHVKDYRIPIIAMTANALKGDRQKCLDAGMDDYLTKPVDPNELEEKLRHWLPKEQQDHRLTSTEQETKEDDQSESRLSSDPIYSKKLKNLIAEGNQREPNESLIWNYDSLLTRVRNNQKLASKLIQLFFHDLPDLSKRLQSAIADENLEEIIAHSHRIKGSAANLSAMLLSKTAAKIETLAREGDIKTIKAITNDFMGQVDGLIERLAKRM